MKIIATKHTDNLVYIDESGIDNTEDYAYGYCKKGERFHALKSGVKRQRVSMIAALNQRKIIAPMTFEGYCDTDVFNSWFEQFLTPILEPGRLCCIAHYTKVSYKNSRNHFKRRHTNFGKFVKYIAFN